MRIPIRCCEDAQLYFTVNCCVSAAGAFGNPAATVRQASIFVGGLSPTEENNSNQLTGEHISLNRHGFKPLGQLTAGIAHEMKNPLNFVNNFSGILQ